MRDLANPKAIWLKGVLFLLLGLGPTGVLLAEMPTLRVAVLVTIVIWSYCRAYYFAFYVIERYVDPGFRFSGLIAFLRYALAGKRTRS